MFAKVMFTHDVTPHTESNIICEGPGTKVQSQISSQLQRLKRGSNV